MVTLPKEFVATRYPGYFFNTKDDQLYSMKIDGVLKPLRFYKPNRFNHLDIYLTTLKSGDRDLEDTNVTIPVKATT